MKLAEVHLKPECRPPDIRTVVLTADLFEMTFEQGLVRITRREDGKTKCIALGNCISVTPADEPKKPAKAA